MVRDYLKKLNVWLEHNARTKSILALLFVLSFFAVLYFFHSHIDIIRLPFFAFIVWAVSTKRLSPGFLFDKVSIAIFGFIAVVLVSNLIHGREFNYVVYSINWLFPYFLAKYVIHKRLLEVRWLVACFLVCSVLFAAPAIAGFLWDVESLFGEDLFKSTRYIFTMSGINRAGFFLGVAFLLSVHMLLEYFKRDWRVTVIVLLCCGIVLFGLIMTQERKSIFTAVMIIAAVLAIRGKYTLILAGLGIILTAVLLTGVSNRYDTEAMAESVMFQRVKRWEVAFELFKEKPLIGHGLPSYEKLHPRVAQRLEQDTGERYPHPLVSSHNINFDLLAETGLLGFVLINWAFFSVYRFVTYRRSEYWLFALGTTIVFAYVSLQFGNFLHAALRPELIFCILGAYMGREIQLRNKA